MTEFEQLKAELSKLHYPDTMAEALCEVKGHAFFPGGKGTFDNSEQISNKDIMVLGQDFGHKKYYDEVVTNGEESETGSKTWNNLLKMLDELEIEKTNCFFTNAIMGVRKEGKMTGKSPAFKDERFIEECRQLFLKQLELQKPKTIFVLGKETAHFLPALAEELHPWKKLGSFSVIDSNGIHTIKVKFKNGIKCAVVLLTHPSFRHANVRRRRFENHEGNDAELAMIRVAMS